MNKEKIEKVILDKLNEYRFELPKDEYELVAEELAETIVKNCSIPVVVGQGEQLKALEDLKDFAYDNCQPHNSDRLAEIMERL